MPAPTLQDYFDIGRAEAISRRPDLTFDEGDISEFYEAAAAAMADHLTGYTASRVRATFLDGAKGNDLTTLADDHWNIQRLDAVSSTGVLTFTRATDAVGAGSIPAGTAVATQPDPQGNSVQFVTDNTLTFGATDLTLTMTGTAVVVGVGGNVAIAKITRVVGSLFDPSITVNNTARFAGGAEVEEDDALRERVRNFPATVRRGTLAALEYGATSVAGVATAVATETSPPDGTVNVYVTDGSGSSSPTMVANVAAELENWRAAGILVNVLGGALITQDITLALSVRAGIKVPSLVSQIQAAVVARVAKLRIGETLTHSMIKQAVLNVDPDILDCSVTTPAGSAVPAANEIIRAGAVAVS